MENLIRECENFKRNQNIEIESFAHLESILYTNDDMDRKFLTIYHDISNEIRFFEVVWDLLKQADNMMDTLSAHNQELDEILSSGPNVSNEDHLLSIESTMTKEIDKLHDDLNKIDFPMSDSEKTSSILLILRPLRQEFGKLQAKIKNAVAEIEVEKTKKQSDAELAQLKAMYEQKLVLFKKPNSNTLRYNDICWPCNGSIEQIIQVMLHGVEKENIRKAIHMHQRFWHPDKFNGLFSTRLHADDSQKILERVNSISVGLNAELAK